MSLNKIFKSKMKEFMYDNTFAQLHNTKNPYKKIARKNARHRMKQDKFYNGFYEFIEENKRRNK